VAIDIVLWGFITKYLNSVSGSGVNFVPSLLGAVLLWDFLTRVMQGVSMAFLEDVWTRNFLNVFASPLETSEYLGGLVLSSIATSMVGLIVMLSIVTGVFGLSFATYGLMFLPFMGILFLFGISLGIFATAVVLRLGPAAEWFICPIPAMISPFAGVFYPVSVLPSWMQIVSRCLPPSYVFESMRAIVSGHEVASSEILIGLALTVFYFILACLFFRRTYRFAVQTGLLARYSAETVT
jgi:ABC-2 type transport system permease protein